jgi:HK97 family phage major capsid protein
MGGNAANAPQRSLLGLPLFFSEYNSALGAPGDLLLCDLSQYVLAERGGITGAESLHVRFEHDERCYRMTWRIDGHPTWTAPLTPYKGANTQSPFIALATRP